MLAKLAYGIRPYGDSLFIAESCGRQDIMTFREKTSTNLRDYFNMPNKNDNEAHKRAIIEAAAKLIKNEIKTIIEPLRDVIHRRMSFL